MRHNPPHDRRDHSLLQAHTQLTDRLAPSGVLGARGRGSIHTFHATNHASVRAGCFIERSDFRASPILLLYPPPSVPWFTRRQACDKRPLVAFLSTFMLVVPSASRLLSHYPTRPVRMTRHTSAPAALELLAPACSGPPKYTPDVTPVPDYSAQPRGDERTMLSSQRPRVPRPSEPTSHLYDYIACEPTGDFQLILAGCRTELVEMGPDGEGCDVPVFARNSVLKGVVVLLNERDTRGVVSVSVHVAGRITVAIDAPGRSAGLPAHTERVMPVLSHSVVVFRAASTSRPEDDIDTDENEATECCPQTMRFELALPPNYADRGRHVRPLPPSYAARISGGPTVGDLWAEVSYSVEVAIVRRSRSGIDRKVVVETPFMYRPRTRPLRPQPFVYPHSDILDVVKMAPHMWEVSTTLLKSGKTMRSEVGVEGCIVVPVLMMPMYRSCFPKVVRSACQVQLEWKMVSILGVALFRCEFSCMKRRSTRTLRPRLTLKTAIPL